VINRVSQILRVKGKNVTVVTKDPVLVKFFEPYGDWTAIANNESALKSGGCGNTIMWQPQPLSTILTYETAPTKKARKADPEAGDTVLTCEVETETLLKAIRKMEEQHRYKASQPW
jgi:hypothetical protein